MPFLSVPIMPCNPPANCSEVDLLCNPSARMAEEAVAKENGGIQTSTIILIVGSVGMLSELILSLLSLSTSRLWVTYYSM